jgi:hypothetical protein
VPDKVRIDRGSGPGGGQERTPEAPRAGTQAELLESDFRRLGDRLERRLEERVGGRLESVLAQRPRATVDTDRIAGSVRALEERIEALQSELRAEREATGGLQGELAAERARSERAERERSAAREETSQFRRVLAAAIANEKYAIELARQSRGELQSRTKDWNEAVLGRGTAEGRAGELERRVLELTSTSPPTPMSIWRAAAWLSLGMLMGLVGLGQWASYLGRKLGSESAGSEPADGVLLGLGLGAFALAVALIALGRRALSSASASATGSSGAATRGR